MTVREQSMNRFGLSLRVPLGLCDLPRPKRGLIADVVSDAVADVVADRDEQLTWMLIGAAALAILLVVAMGGIYPPPATRSDLFTPFQP